MWITSIFVLSILFTTYGENPPVWKYECISNRCQKIPLTTKLQDGDLSLSACTLFCTDNLTLWPKPTGNISYGKTLRHLNTNSIDVLTKKPDSPVGLLVRESAKRFKRNIDEIAPSAMKEPGGKSLIVNMDITDYDETDLTLNTDEKYALQVNESADGRIIATIKAKNYFGARHGLETLGQLIIYDDIRSEIQILSDVTITDGPVYPYRGILLDTARNYISLEVILRTIDAMATSKLNTFHWHITDSQSFPFVSKSNPNLSKYGAYSPMKIYTPDDIKKVINHAKVRGVRVLPEFDAPAHVGEGWQNTDLVACFNAQPWMNYCVEPPCGQLDPTKDQLYDVLEGIYGDMVELFNPDIFHMGGDEVNLSCWNSTKNIVNWMKQQGWNRNEEDFIKLWDVFQRRALERLTKKTGKEIPIIMWTSTLTTPIYLEKYLPKETYIIQIWTTKNDIQVKNLLDKNYRIILSNYDALYLDCGNEAWVSAGNNWCSPFIGWQKVYDNSPLEISGPEKQKNVLGSEAALWTEQVDDTTVDSRLWPRSAAMGERLWTEPIEGWKTAEKRMLIHRERIVKTGVAAAAVQPEWCRQYQDNCPSENPIGENYSKAEDF